MSQSNTPLTDAAKRFYGLWVSEDDCRAIEERLNACVEALEEMASAERDLLSERIPPPGRVLRLLKSEEAIAGARRPI